MYPIVASDLDGTLLSPQHSLTPFAAETLKSITDLGVHFIFATGRHHVDVRQIREKLGIAAYMITSNGARVHDLTGELIIEHNLPSDIAKGLLSLKYNDPVIMTQVYRHDDWYLSHEPVDDPSFFMESEFAYHCYHPDTIELDGISKIFFTSDNYQELLALEQLLRKQWGDRINVCFSLPICLEVMAAGVSKGTALEEVAQRLGYNISQCIAFGDGMNDVEMLSMTGKGCLMSNAHQRLKDTLYGHEIIGSNAEDAVPHYLRRLYQRV